MNRKMKMQVLVALIAILVIAGSVLAVVKMTGNHPGPGVSTETDAATSDTPTKSGDYNVVIHYEGKQKIVPVDRGASLRSMEAPVEDGLVFLGWYYDEETTKSVGKEDIVTSDTDIYAKYGEATDITSDVSFRYASALDVPSDYSVIVEAKGKDVNFVLANLILTNKTDSTRTDDSDTMYKDVLVAESIEDGKFKVYVKNGFEKGHSYQIEKTSDEMNFEGQDAKVIYYNLTVAKGEVINLTIDDSVKYISGTLLSEEDRNNLFTYQGLYTAIKNEETGEISYKTNDHFGTFTYRDGALKVGDNVAVYMGTAPNERTLDYTGDKSVAYVRITEVSGSTYTYQAAEVSDILFIPDIIPIDIDAGDGATGYTPGGTHIELMNEKLDFSSPVYEAMGLSATTTLEPGDFLGFYSGQFADVNAKLKGYAKVTGVKFGDKTVSIDYIIVDYEQVKASMDLYQKSKLDEQQLEDSVDRQYIAQTVKDQLIASGFLEDARDYLASMALKTDEVKELFGEEELSEEDYIVICRDDLIPVLGSEMVLLGDQFHFVGGNNKDQGSNVTVNVTTKLAHFENQRGLRVEVAFTYKFDVKKRNSNKKVELQLTAVFESEVLFDLSVDGSVIWKKAWIFPCIYDYKMTGRFDRGIYTGIALTASAKLSEDDEPFQNPFAQNSSLNGVANQINNLGEAIKNKMKSEANPFPDAKGSASGDFVDKYSSFIEDAANEWVDLFTCPLFEASGSFDNLGVTAYGIKGELVASANMNVTLGMSLQAEESQRNEFSIYVLHKGTETQTMDTGTSGTRFDVYAMGVLGVRAGVRIKATVGLLSTKLDGVGLQVEGGVYAKVYGFFYYTFATERARVIENYAKGALLVDIGLYTDIKFVAEVLDGKFSYTPTIYANEWSLITIGSKYNVIDYIYDEENGSYANSPNSWNKPYKVPMKFTWIKEYDKILPSSLFMVDALNLTTGKREYISMDSDYRAYSSSSRDPQRDDETNFIVELADNEHFKYNPANNTVTVVPGNDGALFYETDITFTYKQPFMSFSTQSIQRTFHLRWIDPDSGRFIAFDTKGGSEVEPIYYRAGATIKPTEDIPQKTGYLFGGWYVDEACTKAYTFPTTMPDYDTTVYAKWIPTPNQYTLRYYKENLYGKYEKIDEIVDTSVYTDDVITPEKILETHALDMTGFEVDYETSNMNGTIDPFGNSVYSVYYKRKIYTATFTYGKFADSQYKDVVYSYKYEYTVYDPCLYYEGYYFEGWDKELPYRMPAEDIVVNATWKPDTMIRFSIVHLIENREGTGYIGYGNKEAVQVFNGIADNNVEEVLLRSIAPGYSLYKVVTNYERDGKPIVSRFGDTIVEIYCNADSYKLSFYPGDGTMTETIDSYKYNREVVLPVPVREGYKFIGWDLGGRVVKKLEAGEIGDLSCFAKYEICESYITFDLGDGEGDNPSCYVRYSDNLDALDNIPVLDGYRFTGFYDAKIGGKQYYGADGKPTCTWDKSSEKVTLYAHYEKEMYEVKFLPNGGDTQEQSMMVQYHKNYGELPEASREGYTFLGWYTAPEGGMRIIPYVKVSKRSNHILYAHWQANEYDYVCEYYVENKDGQFELDHSTTHKGKTDETVTAQPFELTGYSLDNKNENNILSSKVKADGSTVLRAYYARNTYQIYYKNPEDGSLIINTVKHGDIFEIDKTIIPTKKYGVFDGWLYNGRFKVSDTVYVTEDNVELIASFRPYKYTVVYDSNTGNLGTTTDKVESQIVSYGEQFTVTKDVYTLPGYVQDGWNSQKDGTGTSYKSLQEALNLSDTDQATVVLYAQWKPATDTPYEVISYFVMETENGEYKKITKEKSWIERGQTGTTTVVSVPDKTGYLTDIRQTTIKADGTAKVEVFYVRQKYTLTWEFDGATVSDNTYSLGDIYFGEKIIFPVLSKTGYTLMSFSTANTGSVTMPASDLTIRAIFTPNTDTSYFVEYYIETLTGDSYVLYKKEERKGTTGEVIEPVPGTVLGFATPSAKKLEILADGTACVRYEYKRNTYQVIYKDKNTGESKAHSVTYGAKYKPEGTDLFSLQGYTLTAWTDENGKAVGSAEFIMPAHDVILNAKWEANSYLISFDANVDSILSSEKLSSVGSMADQKMVYDLETALQKIGYAIVGYEFTGWNTLPDGSGIHYADMAKVHNLTAVSGDVITLYAQWAAETDTSYTVKHYLTDGVDGNGNYINSKFASEEKLRGETGTLTRARATSFVGFTAQAVKQATIKGDGSTIVEIYYTRNKYQLTFDLAGGTAQSTYTEGEIFYQGTITAPVAIKAGYILSWDIEVPETMPAKDLTITAVWTPRKDTPYTVRHLIETLEEGKYEVYKELTLTGTTNAEVTPSVLEVVGFKVPSVKTAVINGDGSLVVEYKYSRNSYTLMYVNEETGDTVSVSVKYQETVNLNKAVFEKTGYHFAAWKCSNEDIDTSVSFKMPVANLTVSPIWKANSYQVVYEHNEKEDMKVTGTMENSKAQYDVEFVLPDCGYEAVGYIFIGWNTEPDGSGITYQPGDTVLNLTDTENGKVSLYPVWVGDIAPYQIKVYREKLVEKVDENGKITYEIDGFEEFELINEYQELYGKIPPQEGKVGTRPTYTFDELYYNHFWGYMTGYSLHHYSESVIKADGSTVFEIYVKRDKFNLTFDFNGAVYEGKTGMEMVVYRDQPVILPELTKYGYTFEGWDGPLDGITKDRHYTAQWKGNPQELRVICRHENIDGTFTDNEFVWQYSGTTYIGRTYNVKMINELADYGTLKYMYDYPESVDVFVEPDMEPVVIDFKLKYYTYELRGIEGFESYIINTDTYTRSGVYKYGTHIEFPEFDQTTSLEFYLKECLGGDTIMGDSHYEVGVKVISGVMYRLEVYRQWPQRYGVEGDPYIYELMHYQYYYDGEIGEKADVFSKFTQPKGWTLKSCSDTTIERDKDNVIQIYYDLEIVELRLELNGGTIKDGVSYTPNGEYRLHAIKAPSPYDVYKNGYTMNYDKFEYDVSWDEEKGKTVVTYTYGFDLIEYKIVYLTTVDGEYDTDTNILVSNDLNPTTFTAESETFSLMEPEMGKGYIFKGWQCVNSKVSSSIMQEYNSNGIRTITVGEGSYLHTSDDTLYVLLLYDKEMTYINLDLNGGNYLSNKWYDGAFHYYLVDEEKMKVRDIPCPEKRGKFFAYWTGGEDNHIIGWNESIESVRGLNLRANYFDYDNNDNRHRKVYIHNLFELIMVGDAIDVHTKGDHEMAADYWVTLANDLEITDMFPSLTVEKE